MQIQNENIKQQIADEIMWEFDQRHIVLHRWDHEYFNLFYRNG